MMDRVASSLQHISINAINIQGTIDAIIGRELVVSFFAMFVTFLCAAQRSRFVDVGDPAECCYM